MMLFYLYNFFVPQGLPEKFNILSHLKSPRNSTCLMCCISFSLTFNLCNCEHDVSGAKDDI